MKSQPKKNSHADDAQRTEDESVHVFGKGRINPSCSRQPRELRLGLARGLKFVS
jgi:hypothetical protein